MHDPLFYRIEAEKFIEQARHTNNEAHRDILLEEAQTLVRLAEQAELMQTIFEDQVTASAKALFT